MIPVRGSKGTEVSWLPVEMMRHKEVMHYSHEGKELVGMGGNAQQEDARKLKPHNRQHG